MRLLNRSLLEATVKNHIENDVQTKGIKTSFHRIVEQPYRQHYQSDTANKGIKHLLPGIKFQMFLVSRTDTGNADKQECGDFAVNKITVIVNHPSLYPVVYVTQYAVPMVKHRRVNGVLEKLHQDGHIDDCPENLIKALQFLTFFHEYLPLYYLFSVMIGRTLWACHLGVSCMAPLPTE